MSVATARPDSRRNRRSTTSWLAAVRSIGGPYMSTIGRTSMEPYAAPGHRAAASIARSRFSASMT